MIKKENIICQEISITNKCIFLTHVRKVHYVYYAYKCDSFILVYKHTDGQIDRLESVYAS